MLITYNNLSPGLTQIIWYYGKNHQWAGGQCV